MPLKSTLFKGNRALENCLVANPSHILPGARGEHVGKIQRALTILGAGAINAEEIKGTIYGPTTARAVLAYKGPPRNIINTSYQHTPDNIVGIMTIKALDKEIFDFENLPAPGLASIFVSVTRAGSPHDHSKCPPFTNNSDVHLATPINPRGSGRKINIGGEGETFYLGFDDFVTDFGNLSGPPRPMTDLIPSNSVSDICIRSSPMTDRGEREIRRIAMSHCRLTVSTNSEIMLKMIPQLQRLGVTIERLIIDQAHVVAVVDMNEKK
jgi:hypothetical protein